MQKTYHVSQNCFAPFADMLAGASASNASASDQFYHGKLFNNGISAV